MSKRLAYQKPEMYQEAVPSQSVRGLNRRVLVDTVRDAAFRTDWFALFAVGITINPSQVVEDAM